MLPSYYESINTDPQYQLTCVGGFAPVFIESEIAERPMAHIFATSKAAWEEITDELPQYPSYEPGR